MEPTANLSHRTSLRWTLALTSTAFFMVALDALVVATALPAIHRQIHAGLSTLEWTVNAYGLTFAAAMITAAGLGDRFGRRRTFTTGIAVFTAASAACALAPDAATLLAARAVQGLGAAAVMTLSLTILTGTFPADRRGTVVGIWGALGGLAVASGPVIGGAITQGLDWHWIFWVNVPIGAAAALLSARRLPESRGENSSLDPGGLLLSALAAAALVYGLVHGASASWGDAQTVGSLAVSGLALAGLALHERAAAAPMLPPRLFADRSFTAAGAASFLMTGAIMAAAFLVAQYFQDALRETPLITGVKLLPWTLTPTVIAPVAGALSDRVGAKPLIAAGLLLQAGGLAWFAAAATALSSYPRLVAPLIVAGIGISMALPTAPAAALGAVQPRDLGKASGVNSTLQRFGGAFGVAIATAVFSTSHGQLTSPAAFTAGFRPALVTAAGLSALGALAAFAIRDRRGSALAATGGRPDAVAVGVEPLEPEAVV